MAYNYIKDDLAGYPFNSKYPPNYSLYGGMYGGYKNSVEETFYHLFAVQRYDLRFSFNGETYYFLSTENYAAQCDKTFCEEIQLFKDGNDVLEKFEIDGVPLLKLIPQISDCEAM